MIGHGWGGRNMNTPSTIIRAAETPLILALSSCGRGSSPAPRSNLPPAPNSPIGRTGWLICGRQIA